MIKFRIGNGYDVHALAEGESLILGGIRIEHTKGTIAHSDGDVVIHSLCDALLGALALGDIGKHFPDNDPTFKNIDSTILLKKVMDMIREHNYELSNADITIAMQRPKLAPYITSMRERIAQIMGVKISDISIKATTTEELGFVGREDGVEVFSSVLLHESARI